MEHGDYENHEPKRTATLISSSLKDNLEQIVSEINAKRKRDSDLLNELKREFEFQISAAISRIEDSMYAQYNTTNREVEEKIQEFMIVLSKIEKHEADLEEFKQILGVINEDLYVNVATYNPED